MVEPVRTLYLWRATCRPGNAWKACKTQWRTGMAGATGLDYAGVRAWMDLQGLRATSAAASLPASRPAKPPRWPHGPSNANPDTGAPA